jgi:hypothetical protein
MMAMSADANILNLNEAGSPLTFASALAGEHGAAWQLVNDDEFRKLVTTTSTIKPIHNKSSIPADRPRTNFVGAVSARTASLEVIRTLLNSVLANDADFLCCDIADYYLGTPMDRPIFMRIHRRQLSATIIVNWKHILRTNASTFR